MSLVHLSNVCSHLQNASLARLGLTSIPHSRMHLNLSVQLQKQGFLSTVVLGGSAPPDKLLPPKAPETTELFFQGRRRPPKVKTTEEADEGASQPPKPRRNSHGPKFPLNELFPATNLALSSARTVRAEAHVEPTLVTQDNRATRRLWLGLKYWDGEPVLRKMKMLSKPTQRLWVTHKDLSRIVRGSRANYVEGLTRVGECLFVSTDKGVLEARECMERQIGGLVLCRVWG